jgi:hypothetical protein
MRNPEHPDKAEGLAVDAARDSAGTYLSMDGGNTWTPTSVYADWHIRACLIYPHAVEEQTKAPTPSGTLLWVGQNPFRGTALIQYSSSSESRVNLSIFDVRGALVAVLFDEHQEPGAYRAKWSAEKQPSGVYFCRLRVDDFTKAVKIVKLAY